MNKKEFYTELIQLIEKYGLCLAPENNSERFIPLEIVPFDEDTKWLYETVEKEINEDNELTYNNNKNLFLSEKINDKSLDTKITWIDDYHALLQTPTFKEMNQLFYGLAQWSIIVSNSQWNIYVGKIRKQYVFLDFTKKQNDNKSIIGFTYNPREKLITTAHEKNGRFINEHNLKNYMMTIGIIIDDYIK